MSNEVKDSTIIKRYIYYTRHGNTYKMAISLIATQYNIPIESVIETVNFHFYPLQYLIDTLEADKD